MSIASASRADAAPSAAAPPSAAAADGAPVLVWDAPVRVIHAAMALAFFGAWLTAESERWRLVHTTLGWIVGGLVVLRIVLGFAGTRHARFSAFVRGPRAVLRYVREMIARRPEHHIGHNPLGGWAVVALLAMGALVVASGWALEADRLPVRVEELHEALATAMLALVGAHIAGVLMSSWLHRENLVRGMVTGIKRGSPRDALAHRGRPLAILIVAAVAGFAAWHLQQGPSGDAAADAPPAAARPVGGG